MNVYRNLLIAAAGNVARYKIRSAVVVACLVAICGPYVTGVAISEGIRADAALSVSEGADLYLTLDQFGRNGPVPLKYLPAFRRSPNITAVIPRIVGRATTVVGSPDGQPADTTLVVILGLEPEQMKSAPWRETAGQWNGPRDGEVMVGAALADHFMIQSGQQITLKVGDVTMSFRVSAVFPREATIWSAQLVCMTLEDAGKLFGLPGYASDFSIYCRPGPGNIQAVRQDSYSILGDIPYRLQTKNGEVASYLDKGFRQQQGIFTVLFLGAFAVGIPALLIASGLGLSEPQSRNRDLQSRRLADHRRHVNGDLRAGVSLRNCRVSGRASELLVGSALQRCAGGAVFHQRVGQYRALPGAGAIWSRRGCTGIDALPHNYHGGGPLHNVAGRHPHSGREHSLTR